MHRRVRFCAALLTVLCTGPAYAAGYYNVDQGVESFGAGGSMVARPGNASGVYLNPADLVSLSGFDIMLGADYVLDYRSHARASAALDDTRPDEVTDFDKVTNELGFAHVPSPNIFMGYGFEAGSLGKMGVGAGVWGPPRSDQIFSDNGAQRYSSIRNENLQIHFGASAAWEIYKPLKLRLGATAMLVQVTVAQRLGLNSAGVFAAPEDPDYDIFADVAAKDPAIFSGLYALSMQPVEGLTLAATFQSGFEIAADGTLEVQIGEALAGAASIDGDTIEITARMPSVARFGVDFAPTDKAFGVSAALVWEGWGVNDVQTVKPVDINLTSTGETSPLAPILIQNNYQDTWSVRVGGRYTLGDAWILRSGLLYETSAVPDEYRSLGTFDLDKVGVTTGATYFIGETGLRVTLALGAIKGLGTEVNNSNVLAQDPLNPDGGTVIGNGRYDTLQLTSMLGLGWAF
jgi:long-chain fatty acid transport protein